MKFILLIASGLLWISCSVKPEPLVIGKDACHTCKMTLVDTKFGAELITTKGKIYKFDDINCMVGFYESGFVAKEEVHSVLAVDYANGPELLDARNASYVLSDQLRTPMGSSCAAFGVSSVAIEYNEKLSGRVLTWEEVLSTF